MPAACRFELSCAAAPHRGQLRPAGHQPRQLAPARARHRRPLDRDVQRHLVLPLPRARARCNGCSASPIVAGPADVPVAARGPRRRHAAARLA